MALLSARCTGLRERLLGAAALGLCVCAAALAAPEAAGAQPASAAPKELALVRGRIGQIEAELGINRAAQQQPGMSEAQQKLLRSQEAKLVAALDRLKQREHALAP